MTHRAKIALVLTLLLGITARQGLARQDGASPFDEVDSKSIPELAKLDFLIGKWTVQNFSRNSQGKKATTTSGSHECNR